MTSTSQAAAAKWRAPFRTLNEKPQLTAERLTLSDVRLPLVKHRVEAAGLPHEIPRHTVRATTNTAYLEETAARWRMPRRSPPTSPEDD